MERSEPGGTASGLLYFAKKLLPQVLPCGRNPPFSLSVVFSLSLIHRPVNGGPGTDDHRVWMRVSNLGQWRRTVTLSSTTSQIWASQVALISR